MRLYDDQLIVITGGAGFIGSCLIKHLNEKGISNILIVDDLGKTEKWKNLVGKQFLQMVSRHEIFSWLQGREKQVEAFIHLGACSSTVETDASYLYENNTLFSIKLADYALKNGHRFVYASSAATYGDGKKGFSDDESLLKDYEPLNMYGFSKHLFDLWLQNEGLLDKVVGLKYFNVFGPNENHKGRMASAVFHMYPHAHQEGVVRLFESSEPNKFANGGQQRDFIYVKDAVRMTADFLTNNATGIFNIGSGTPSTWNQLAESLFRALHKKSRIEYIPMPNDLIGKYQNYTCAEMQKGAKALGNSVKCMPLEEAVDDYVNNYLLQDKRW